MHWTAYTDIAVGLLIIVFYLLLYRKQSATVKTLETTITALKTQLEALDPKKFADMQAVYDDFNEKKTRLEVSKRVENFRDLADRKMDEGLDSIFNELSQFLIVFLNKIPNDKRARFIKRQFPKNKALIHNIYAEFGAKSKDDPPKPAEG